MATVVYNDETKKIDAESCRELGGIFEEETKKCILPSTTDAISDGEKVAVIPEGKDETVVVPAEQFEDVTQKMKGSSADSKKYYRVG